MAVPVARNLQLGPLDPAGEDQVVQGVRPHQRVDADGDPHQQGQQAQGGDLVRDVAGEDEEAEAVNRDGALGQGHDVAAELEVELVVEGGLEEHLLVDPVLAEEDGDRQGHHHRDEVREEADSEEQVEVVGVVGDHVELLIDDGLVEVVLELVMRDASLAL